MEITKGKIPSAIKVVIYGAEGIGKSTFASKFPNPLYIDTEGSTKQLDVSRLPTPKTWKDILDEIEYVINNPTICQTLVIDTADWAEKMCIEYTCQRLNVKNIEDVGFGKGYVYLEQDFKHFLKLLDQVIAQRINVVLTAHALIRTFSQPGGLDSYDRYELKLQKKTTPLLKEWSDLLLFANYKTMIITDAKTNRKIDTGGERLMYANHTPSYDAKNRFDLPDEMPFEYSSIAHIFNDEPQPQVKEEKTKMPIEQHREEYEKFLTNLEKMKIDEIEVFNWAAKNNITIFDLRDIEADLMKYLNENFDAFYTKIVEMRNPLGE